LTGIERETMKQEKAGELPKEEPMEGKTTSGKKLKNH
jgi:hypothetical protein